MGADACQRFSFDVSEPEVSLALLEPAQAGAERREGMSESVIVIGLFAPRTGPIGPRLPPARRV